MTFLSPVDVSNSTFGITCRRLTYTEAATIFGDALQALADVLNVIELLP